MVSSPDSEVSGPGASPGRGHCIVFLGKTLCSHNGLASHPGGSRKTPSRFMLLKLG